MDEQRTDAALLSALEEEECLKLFQAYLSQEGESCKERIKEKTLQKLKEGSAAGSVPVKAVQRSPHRRFWTRRRLTWSVGIAAAAVLLVVAGIFSQPLWQQWGYYGSMAGGGRPSAGQEAADSYDGELYNRALLDTDMVAEDNGASFKNMEGAAATDPSSTELQQIEPALPLPEPNSNAPATESLGKKIIYTVDTTLKVNDLAQARSQIEERTQSLSGYIVNTSFDNSNATSYAYLTVKIPSEELETFTTGLADVGTITYLNRYSEDIGVTYYDTASRLKNLQAQEERYREILQDAETIEEVLQVENMLSTVRQSIESLQGQLQYWDNQVDYSQVSISLQPLQSQLNVNDPWAPVSFQSTLIGAKNALVKTVSTVWNLFNKLVILIGYALPLLIVITVAWFIWRRYRKQTPSA